MQLTETAMFFLALLIPNLVGLILAFAKISSRLTKIETDIAWIVKNCARCHNN